MKTTEEIYSTSRMPTEKASVEASAPSEDALETKQLEVIRLLDSWLADTSGYDEKTWPIVKRNLEENRLSTRKRFHD